MTVIAVPPYVLLVVTLNSHYTAKTGCTYKVSMLSFKGQIQGDCSYWLMAHYDPNL